MQHFTHIAAFFKHLALNQATGDEDFDAYWDKHLYYRDLSGYSYYKD